MPNTPKPLKVRLTPDNYLCLEALARDEDKIHPSMNRVINKLLAGHCNKCRLKVIKAARTMASR